MPFDLGSLTAQSFAAFDATLASPLGSDSPISPYYTSPLFSDDGTTVSLPGLEFSFPLFGTFPLASVSSQPAPTPTPTPTPIATPKPSTSRAPAPLVDLAAPVAPRTYLLPSATSRKRKTTHVERELAKRKCSSPETDELAADIPEDLIAAVEKKRAQNTLSARKSRMRKQQLVGELEQENARLKEEKDALTLRVARLEKLLVAAAGVPLA